MHSSSSRSCLHLLRLSVLARDMGIVMANLEEESNSSTQPGNCDTSRVAIEWGRSDRDGHTQGVV